MMFDRDLFLSLCEKYKVELSETASSPMIKDGTEVRTITNDDVSRIFAPCQEYFDYSDIKIKARDEVLEFYLQENFAIAC